MYKQFISLNLKREPAGNNSVAKLFVQGEP
jgi:hypothetical protein